MAKKLTISKKDRIAISIKVWETAMKTNCTLREACLAHGIYYQKYYKWEKTDADVRNAIREYRLQVTYSDMAGLREQALKTIRQNLTDRVVEETDQTVVERDGKKTKVVSVKRKVIPASQKAAEFLLVNLMPENFTRQDKPEANKPLEQMTDAELDNLERQLSDEDKLDTMPEE